MSKPNDVTRNRKLQSRLSIEIQAELGPSAIVKVLVKGEALSPSFLFAKESLT